MLKRLLGKAPVEVWVIKQVDDDLLHLCGQGILESRDKRGKVIKALSEGRFEGAVHMSGGGVVLNSRLFAALVPIKSLKLLPQGQARWKGRDWLVAQVPQRCWAFRGPLVAHTSPVGGGLISSEDVADIRQRVDETTPRPPGEVVFRPLNAHENEAPSLTPKHESKNSTRPGYGREWRGKD
ncbi:hypothetical protein KG088_10785 [Halomonas sp. TRM85114]|uniref:hypothetical protein n=1 Tax=Halomonas jincaotanensis TaxID=2810616 RepID=UPI001BD37147|nr:hypothetical protein [Halomonas jincaotanensis]MBS9404116.1 hypothetical protein [Halomonas jincaotanensis]